MARRLRAICLAGCLTVCLSGCPTRPGTPATPAGAKPSPLTIPHEGRPYDVASGESVLTVLVFRGGPLAKAGHNHVIASHDLSGTFYVPVDPVRSSFEVRLPLSDLAVDEAPLRAKENEAEFPPDVPESAREGTRHNMLGDALLDAEHFPQILLQSERLEAISGGPEAKWLAHVKVTVRGRTTSVAVPVRYTLTANDLVASGEFPLRQTDLGLKPFTALLGALQVVDEMQVRFRIAAHASATYARH